MMSAGLRRVGIVTVGRSDHGIIGPVVRAMVDDDSFDPLLIVTGDNGDHVPGLDVPVLVHVPVTYGDASPAAMSAAMGEELNGLARAIGELNRADWPDFVLLTGDRFEMMAAACAFLPLNIPLCHLHGGEASFGAIDDAVRHAITKLCHLHFTATQEAADRIEQMGEESWRITVTGAPALDNLVGLDLLDPTAMARSLDFPMLQSAAPILVTLHPETRDGTPPRQLARAVLDALDTVDSPIVITHPNADPGGREILSEIEAFAVDRANVRVVSSLGALRYFSMLEQASVMIGNSSSGLIEAPSFALPVVNVGARQQGRQRAVNVIDCAASAEAVRVALARANKPAFRTQVQNTPSPFGDGRASERILGVLTGISVDQELLAKKFVDLDR